MTDRRDVALVVDDSPDTLGFLTEALEADGVMVLVATSGSAALAIAGRVTPDIVLMDAVMPEMDGFETCRRLKAISALAHVPVIFMTGLTETEHVVHGLESGGVDYLTKPINIDELRARIRVHLANARQSLSARVALDATGRHLVAVSSAGVIRWMTPQAARLVASTADGDAWLAEAAAAWLAAGGAAGGRTTIAVDMGAERLELAYLGMAGIDEFLFRLARPNASDPVDVLRRQLGLTAREAEVLLWIGRGKPNKDIGDILGLSPRTVNKHLEQIYVKLGVENRASAAIRSLQVLSDS